ncbi:hypothetical protein [Pedobacter sp. P26]|uniref:hypothetical protein n=1 Tax=Pedobacter sp. P26 TaxID=3423956 RepID=UPI003D666D83
MNWTEFFMILTGIYFAYYGLNLVFDLLNAGERTQARPEDDGVLHFTEDEPELIIPAKETVSSAVSGLPATQQAASGDAFSLAGLISSGTVSLKQLF